MRLSLSVLALVLVLVTVRGGHLDKWYVQRAHDLHEAWGQAEGVVTLPSGLQYRVVEEGTGAQPSDTDRVSVRYRLHVPTDQGPVLVGNNVYEEDGELKGAPTTFVVANMLDGWRRGLKLMREGAHYEFYVPYYLAYGRLGRRDTRPSIPAFSPLIINTWLDQVVPANETELAEAAAKAAGVVPETPKAEEEDATWGARDGVEAEPKEGAEEKAKEDL